MTQFLLSPHHVIAIGFLLSYLALSFLSSKILPSTKDLIRMDHHIGEKVFAWFQKRFTLRLLARLLTISGDGVLWFTIYPLLSFYYYTQVETVEAGKTLVDLFLGCTFLCILLEFSIKASFRRKRPEMSKKLSLPGPESYSFPSGHTTRVFYIATFLSLTFPHVPFLPYLLFFWATIVGISRVAVGEHFPTDCICGFSLGLSLGVLTPGVTTEWRRRFLDHYFLANHTIPIHYHHDGGI
eukprot:TRINITY_DN2592_c0_g1_i1.p1 TRINITY_DN2592_c0_g1~~TRINITY_DN2592_c0_g1_i1.p1  ORF type:complete len:239 (+),score=16.94 TRINITY_DN2592_c0_g1_i1:145-861(+)